MLDSCPMCQRPEGEHTAEELEACWVTTRMAADLRDDDDDDEEATT